MMNKIVIIGGANIDIIGKPYNTLTMHDSNPGHIQLQYGGVGRNIAQVFASLETNVSLVTCFGDDAFSLQLQDSCRKLGIDISLSQVIPGQTSSTYLAVLDERGDMVMGISDMGILDQLDVERLCTIVKELDHEDVLVLDTNLSQEILVKLAQNATCYIASDPVSVAKAKRIEPILSSLQVFKPNQFEATLFTGIEIIDEDSAKASLQYFLEAGVKETIISLSDQGILLGTDKEKVWLQNPPVNVINATGGGDTLFATYITYRLQGYAPIEAAIYGMCGAIAVVSGEKTTKENIEKIAKEMQISKKML